MTELPQTWADCRLGDVIDYGVTQKSEPSEISDDAWVLELEDIEKDTSRLLDRQTFAQRQSKSTKNRFDAGDVLYGKLRPYLNKVLIADQPGYCTTEILPLKAGSHLDARYLFYWLKHPTFLAYVEAESHGLNMPRLGTDTGRAAPFVLAPHAEQTRIADKLDAVLARVDACRDRLDHIPAILKRFRQSVLAAATSGKLTEDWRADQVARMQPQAESANTARDSAQLRNAVTAVTNSTSLDRGDEWHVTSLGQCGTVSGGLTKNARRETLALKKPYLRVANVYANCLDLADVSDIGLTEAEHAKTRLVAGDLLIVEGNGSLDQLGRVAMWNDELRDCVHQNHLIRWRTAGPLPKFVLYWLMSPRGRSDLMDLASTTTGLHTLSISKVSAVPVELPSVQEQTEIVRRVEALFAYADRLEARYAAARAQVEKLTPATLAKAFRGELVAQDPNDEPASELLARIAAERATNAAAPRARRPVQRKAARAPKENAAMTKSRQDDDVKGQPYLAQHLRLLGGSAPAEALFKAADLPVADFYKQLAWEVAHGLVRDGKTVLEAADAA